LQVAHFTNLIYQQKKLKNYIRCSTYVDRLKTTIQIWLMCIEKLWRWSAVTEGKWCGICPMHISNTRGNAKIYPLPHQQQKKVRLYFTIHKLSHSRKQIDHTDRVFICSERAYQQIYLSSNSSCEKTSTKSLELRNNPNIKKLN
jgi:hypothetical protein